MPCVCYEQFPGEIVKAPDGRWLGGFQSQEIIPKLVYANPFDVIWPVGWTGATWYETPGGTKVGTCNCTDCGGEYTANKYGQRRPGAQVTCDNSTVFDFWDYAISPKKWTGSAGEGCCSVEFRTDRNCIANNQFFTGACTLKAGCYPVYQTNATWPLTTFAMLNPSSAIRVVTDSSGPVGCEDLPALEVDFSGSGLEGVSWIGANGGYSDSSPSNGYSTGYRSATGWTIGSNSCWIIRFWIKAVPDADSFTCTGYPIQTRFGMWPFPFAEDFLEYGSHQSPPFKNRLILDGTWQEYYLKWQAVGWLNPGSFPDPMLNAVAAIYTTASNSFDFGCSRPLYKRKGRIHIKNVHIYPCDQNDYQIDQVIRAEGVASASQSSPGANESSVDCTPESFHIEGGLLRAGGEALSSDPPAGNTGATNYDIGGRRLRIKGSDT